MRTDAALRQAVLRAHEVALLIRVADRRGVVIITLPVPQRDAFFKEVTRTEAHHPFSEAVDFIHKAVGVSNARLPVVDDRLQLPLRPMLGVEDALDHLVHLEGFWQEAVHAEGGLSGV